MRAFTSAPSITETPSMLLALMRCSSAIPVTRKRADGRMSDVMDARTAQARAGGRRYRAYVDRQRPAPLHPVRPPDRWTTFRADGARVPARVAAGGRAAGAGADHLDPPGRRRARGRGDPCRHLRPARPLPRA